MTNFNRMVIDPERNFTYKTKMKELKGKSFNEIVELFNERISKWYIEPGEILLSKSVHYDFIVMTINIIIIDLLSQYRYNKKENSPKTFKKFLREHIPEFDEFFENQGKITYFNKNLGKFDSEWVQTFPANYYNAFYKPFRNGIVHNAMILPYGGIGRDYSEILHEEPWNDNITLAVNTKLLFEKIKEVFGNYIEQLKENSSNNDILRCNFKAKFYRDFGYKI